MRQADEKYKAVKAALLAHADPERAVPMAAYMRSQFAFMGIPAAVRRQAYKAELQAFKKEAAVDYDFLNLCFLDDYREMQYFVVDALSGIQRRLTPADVPKIEPYLRFKQWWDTVDGLDKVVGRIGLNDPAYRPEIEGVMRSWGADSDFWMRRAAIDHQRGMKDRTNPDLLAELIEMNLGSDEFFINKAIGWSLREYSKTNPDWVRDFLKTHAKRMARLSVTEAGKYL
ncbi:DNA alkylation repair protein [Pseudoramibacter sp.]|jgi:3-methyladenine DNA glycosylase AlkD|uniref:DNA alkylation repair protein n=1 Tax=Pseudoramibacter sp. TaxID=2034862 RepID=UPI0025DEB309|nr:DNA alkylation repair protein [Pseudoramibacter sp.]MCH4072170.1 DNA alkylation repair protein [Pseudoramibacter sp.]MCH4105940.1 DNA alkylation repair protein [Pseudoramibacter sp.]